jgi:hypothetical protein
MPMEKNPQMEKIIDQRIGRKTRRNTYFEYILISECNFHSI